MKFQGLVKIIQKEFLSDDVFKIVIEKPKQMDAVKPGQFFNFNVERMLLRRPISVSAIGEETLEFTIKILGKGTEELSLLKTQDEVDIMGPLGNGFDTASHKKVLLVGGGIGIAPIKGLGGFFDKDGVEIKTLLGFRDKPYMLEAFKAFSNEVIIVSENDADYRQGYITLPLEETLKNQNEQFDMIYACGPSIMLKSVQKICAQFNAPVQLLMEEKMACGIGACLVCTCKTKSGDFGYKHSRMCLEGPMFFGDEVIFDE
ncbi:dihydroorotate dehydrogenase electron transfer subunit [Fusibacter ferrireducens]|uniref:Dihydroorotate dehydrogenase electron transfer subunit n=1 Tax=Fusibacter ferrireducens TaxID=2785058 RepID=A0ABR9ZZC1_9FIRM|nr:dihydroorotate dehydrogenase electron transfer subunit [Fusibacter ferrireducens]MBF4695799.1 dihydroorotate dehydrogenase electron transfer subunit [Fusibacter ferrireducens]